MASKRYKKIKWEFVGLNSLVLVFVVMLLTYTFVHTGAVLARYINPPQLGYIAAFGIEGLVAVLSWRRAFKTGSTKAINATLAIVLTISAAANMYEGYAVKNGHELTIADLPNLDIIQSVIGVLVTAVIPMLVFMAGEVMGKGIEEFGKFVSSMTETEPEPVVSVEPQTIVVQEPERQFTLCEYCHGPLKDNKPQTRSAHLRYCDEYKSSKLALIVETNGNGHAQ